MDDVKTTMKHLIAHVRMHQYAMLIGVSLAASSAALAQNAPYQTPLRWPRTAWAEGMGQQGGASGGAGDAFAYNPALFATATEFSVSVFRMPFYNVRELYALDIPPYPAIPLQSLTLCVPLSTRGDAIGFEYINEAAGLYRYIDYDVWSGGAAPEVNSAALGYARPLGAGLRAGIATRLSTWARDAARTKYLSVSAGVQWTAELFGRTFNAGASMLDVGLYTSMKGWAPLEGFVPSAQETPQPTAFRLDAGVPVLVEQGFRLPLMIGVSQPVFDENKLSQRLQRDALMREWSDMPRDFTLHLGMGFEWSALALGKEFSIRQRLSMGTYPSGPEDNRYRVCSIAGEVGLGYKAITATAGVAAEWQQLTLNGYAWPNWLPKEMFQFSVHLPAPIGSARDSWATDMRTIDRILLSAGIAYGVHLRPPSKTDDDAGHVTGFEAEAAFYLTDVSALVMTLARNQEEMAHPMSTFNGKPRDPTYTLSRWKYCAQYRWHPLPSTPVLFVQGGAGITHVHGEDALRIPSGSIIPELLLGVGASFLLSRICLQPNVEYAVSFESESTKHTYRNAQHFDRYRYTQRVSGYSDLCIGMKAGYAWK